EQFVTEVLDGHGVTVRHDPMDGRWFVKARRGTGSQLMRVEYGTASRHAADLLEATMNQSTVTVRYTDAEGTSVVDREATLAAREKQDRLIERFGQWVWEDPQRSERLAEAYNERFNAHVAPAYDGSHMQLPGLGTEFTPRPHQRAA